MLRVVLPVTAATLVTGAVVGVAVTSGGQDAPVEVAAPAAKPMTVTVKPGDSPYLADRTASFSRSAKRVTMKVKPKVKDRKFMTAPLNLWPAPHEKGKPLRVLPRGGKVGVTSVRRGGFAQILFAGQVRWVNQDYLADKMPKPPVVKKAAPAVSRSAAKPAAKPAAKRAGKPSGKSSSRSSASSSAPSTGGLSSAPCADGSGTESGLTSSAVRLFRAACAAFPALSSYGGYDAHGEHSSGRAIDFMVTDPSLGQALADWARAHAGALNLYDIIWQQHIWTPVRSAEGWRSMPDRGSPTANHYDHVHISVN